MPNDHQPHKLRSAGLQFSLLAGGFVLVFSMVVTWLALDQSSLLATVQSLQNQTLPQTIQQQRMSRNLEVLRLQGERALYSQEQAQRIDALFVVALIANHPITAAYPKAKALASEVDVFLAQHTQPPRLPDETPAAWNALSRRLAELADEIATEGSQLGIKDLEAMETLAEQSNQKLMLVALLAALMLAGAVVLLVRTLIAPLQHIHAALSHLNDRSTPPELPPTGTAEIATIHRAIRQLQVTLHEKEVAQQALRLREAMLEAEKKVAEEATRSKSEFLSSISHEIRTPVSAIMGMSYLVLKTELTLRQRECLQVVQQCSQHLHELIKQVLDHSKIEAHRLTLEHTPFALQAALDNVRIIHAEAAATKGLALTLRTDAHVPPVLVGDPLRFTEIMLNFVNNAIKFTPSGSVDLAITTLQRQPNRVQLKVSVRDTGIGLAPEHMGRLFRRFSQADSSITRHYGGTGLGLSITKQLAELMGGEVGAQSLTSHGSEISQGSEFWATVWLDTPATPHLSHPATPLATVTVPPSPTTAPDADKDTAGHPDALAEPDGPQPLPQATLRQVHELTRLALRADPAALDLLQHNPDGLLAALQTQGRTGQVVLSAVQAYELPKAAAALAELAWAPVQHEPEPVPELESDATEDTVSHRHCLLLVDDNPMNLTLLVRLLGPQYQLKVATSGPTALALMHTSPTPDLVLLDVAMPGMDGYETLRQMRAQATGATPTPVIFTSADATIADQEKGLELGACDYIGRPMSPPLLMARVHTHLVLHDLTRHGLQQPPT